MRMSPRLSTVSRAAPQTATAVKVSDVTPGARLLSLCYKVP